MFPAVLSAMAMSMVRNINEMNAVNDMSCRVAKCLGLTNIEPVVGSKVIRFRYLITSRLEKSM